MEHPVQLLEVHVPHADDPAEERKSPEDADPLLKPKLENNFLILFFPQAVQQVASSDILRAKCSKVSPHDSHLYS